MKLLAAILLSLSYASIVAGQPQASTCSRPNLSDWVGPDLKGPLKVIRTFETWFVVSEKTGRIEKKPRELESETKFDLTEDGDSMGYGVGVSVPAGVVEVKDICGADGRLKELRFINEDGSSYPSATYTYDDAGNVIEEVNTSHVHPEHFRPKRYDVYVTTKTSYKYDARRNRIEEKHFSPNGALYSTYLYNYDGSNRLIKKTEIDKIGRIDDQYFYEYHTDGRLLTEIHFANFCYTKEDEFCKGNISSGDGFFYYGSRTTYRYDSQGNWVKQIESSMDGTLKKPVWTINKITEREITYYRNTQR